MASKRWEPTDDEITLIEEWAANGVAAEEIAAGLGIGRTTLFAAIKRNEPLRNACARARSRANATITGRLFQMAGEDPKAAEFWLRCRAGWLTETEKRKADTESQRLEVQRDQASKLSEAVESGGLVILPAKEIHGTE